MFIRKLSSTTLIYGLTFLTVMKPKITPMRLSKICTYILSFFAHLLTVLRSVEAMTHPRCVGWGEIGLDYHYNNSPRELQRAIFVRQLRKAVELGKPLTIHTREAEDDTERILKAEVPKEHRVGHNLLIGTLDADTTFRYTFTAIPILQNGQLGCLLIFPIFTLE